MAEAKKPVLSPGGGQGLPVVVVRAICEKYQRRKGVNVSMEMSEVLTRSSGPILHVHCARCREREMMIYYS